MTSALNRLIDRFTPAWTGRSEETLVPDMQKVLDRLIEKIASAPIETLPDDNIYMEDVFASDVYAQILALLPGDEAYEDLGHPDAILPDGTTTRKVLDLTEKTLARLQPEKRAFWGGLQGVFTSAALQQAIAEKFRRRLDEQYGSRWPRMVAVPLFYRDLPGYRIGIHPDATTKIATMQFYFPKDESQIHLGTSFHVKDGEQFRLLRTNAFKPNSAYAFVRTNHSWHSVGQLGPDEARRDTLALTIYRKGAEHKGGYVSGGTEER